MSNQAWECYKCNRVNAPWMPHCSCHLTGSSSSGIGITNPIGNYSYPVDLRICGLCGTQFKFGESHHCNCMQSGGLTLAEIRQRCSHEWNSTHNPSNAQEKFCVKCGVNNCDVPCAGGWL
jgi:hypothetical protein